MSAVLLAKRHTFRYLINQLDGDYYMAVLPWSAKIRIQQGRWSDDPGYLMLFAGINDEEGLAVTEEISTVDPRADQLFHLVWHDELETMPLVTEWPSKFIDVARNVLNAEKEFREELGVSPFDGYNRYLDEG